MPAPTTPTVAQLASMGEADILAEVVGSGRRITTAAGGTPGASPALAEIRTMSASRVYPEFVLEMRRLENSL